VTLPAYTIFDTAVGPCGIAWADRGIVGVQLPEGDQAAVRRRLQRRFSGARESMPPPVVQGAIDRVQSLLRGERTDLSDVTLDMRGIGVFQQRVYEIARTIAPGATVTYGELAVRLGDPTLAREVGQALARNPFPIIVPCHRVLAAGGRLGGFSATGGVATKRRLLEIEGAVPPAPLTLF
jgi:methylated-DNA-[protein]-cysteine S-methyltransferase